MASSAACCTSRLSPQCEGRAMLLMSYSSRNNTVRPPSRSDARFASLNAQRIAASRPGKAFSCHFEDASSDLSSVQIEICSVSEDQTIKTPAPLLSAFALPSAGISLLLLQAVAVVPSAAAETIFPAVAFLTADEVETTFYLILFFGFYFLVAPLGVYNYLRLRWYKRNMPETFLQYLLFFLFFPAMLLWAPFINFRRFPRDQSEI
eukprot:TRINITY_DN38572_c0_g1_i1.p1 TRINITY_DN38572_c0_g1~~TRINITY_DN38572_c0_g1_i1.p1  ORF type:complete len:206 (-),score=19.01 TRINITY_DN38572_c0_g1_i1:235-852(-)